MVSVAATPFTEKELRVYIWYACGGLARSEDYWDHRLTYRENSASYGWLDRKWGEGKQVDVMADEIATAWPWYGIQDGNDLMNWLQDNPGPG